MRFGRRVHRERVLDVELTPMIDVVFLLIIFFMTAARFAQDTRADLELPRERGEQQEVREEAGLIINLDAAGGLFVGRRELTLDELEEMVRSEVGRLPGRDVRLLKLMIRADRNADSGRLNEIVSRLRGLGVGAARLATEVPSSR